jgi:molecular chaperone GrpE
VLAEELARLEAEDAAHAAEGAAAALAEPADSSIQRLEREVAEWKDRALRASADFDNYRKRAIKERDEAWGRGAAESFAKLTDAIDDLARVAHLDPEKTTAQSLHEGMLSIERKLMRTLESAGLERIDPVGQKFDPRVAEAISTMPAPNPEADQTVGVVYQAGYQYKGHVLRPARVVVQQWSGESAGTGGDSA